MGEVERIETATRAIFEREAAGAVIPHAEELLRLANSGANYHKVAIEHHIGRIITAAGVHMSDMSGCGQLAECVLEVAHAHRT